MDAGADDSPSEAQAACDDYASRLAECAPLDEEELAATCLGDVEDAQEDGPDCEAALLDYLDCVAETECADLMDCEDLLVQAEASCD